MARIKIKDLSEDQEISHKELRQVLGGMGISYSLQVQSGLRIQLQQTRSKTSTASSFSEIASQGLSKAADGTMSAGKLAAPYIPGGSVLSAAVSG